MSHILIAIYFARKSIKSGLKTLKMIIKIRYFVAALAGGPLGSQKFPLWQFHFHWGSGDGWGSCHTLNGRSFPGEVHFATWNKERYESATTAIEHPDGVAVLAYFLELGEENEAFEEIIANLHKIRYNGETIMGLKPIRLEKLLPEHLMSCMQFASAAFYIFIN